MTPNITQGKPSTMTTKPITSGPIAKPEVYKIDPKWQIPMDGHRPDKIK